MKRVRAFLGGRVGNKTRVKIITLLNLAAGEGDGIFPGVGEGDR